MSRSLSFCQICALKLWMSQRSPTILSLGPNGVQVSEGVLEVCTCRILQTRRYKSWCKPGKRINLTVCIHGSAGSCWIRDGHDSSILLQMLSKWVNPGKDRKYMEIWFGSRISIDFHSIPLCLWKALWINHFWWLCWLSCWRLGLGGHGKGQLFLGRWQIEKYLHVSSCIYIPYNYIII